MTDNPYSSPKATGFHCSPRHPLLPLPAVADNGEMEAEPPKIDAPKRKRRWYQFSLRTLMILITLLAVPLGYVGWQAQIVRERKAMALELQDAGALFFSSAQVTQLAPRGTFGIGGKEFNPPYPTVTLVRRWLGDDYTVGIELRRSVPPGTESRAAAVFPEAVIQRQMK